MGFYSLVYGRLNREEIRREGEEINMHSDNEGSENRKEITALQMPLQRVPQQGISVLSVFPGFGKLGCRRGLVSFVEVFLIFASMVGRFGRGWVMLKRLMYESRGYQKFRIPVR